LKIHPSTKKIKITDPALIFLKKYCSIASGYSNKDQYSAPEVFEQKGNVNSSNDIRVDVYSFGMIAW